MAKVKEDINTVDGLVTSFRAKYGESVGGYGGSILNTDRIPTGCFEFDLATGGGFPRGKCSVIYGPESSNKTNIALLAIKNHQILWPDLICVFFNIEGEYNKDWATRIGVNVDKLVVLNPPHAEACVDQVEAMLCAEDVGLVVIDSLAALVTTQEMESSAEKANVGGAGLVIGKLCRKTSLALREAELANRFPALIYINQIRHKIGVMFGDPETMPGGFYPRYQAALWVRFYGKNYKDPKISPNMPIRKDVDFIIKKWKVPIVASQGKFEMVTVPHKGLDVGQTDDFSSVKSYLESYGVFSKAQGGGYTILDAFYKTQADFETRLYTDKVFGAEVRGAIINRVLLDNNLITAGDLPEIEA